MPSNPTSQSKVRSQAEPIAELRGATLRRGSQTIWGDVNLQVMPGEFIAVLGPNGAGKTTLLKALLGLIPLHTGETRLFGHNPSPVTNQRVGYLPQQRMFDPDINVRGRDIVELGLNGTRLGWGNSAADTQERVDVALRSLGATQFASAPVGLLSGGQQQRLRIAQLLVSDPELFLCDEPFLSLDAKGQHTVSRLLAERQKAGAAIVFVTHDLNAEILPLLSRVLYMVNGRWILGRPNDILTSEALSSLYGSPVGVVRAGGRVMVLPHSEHEEHSIDIGTHTKRGGR